MNKSTLSYGIIGAAVAVGAIALMVGSALLTAYAQDTFMAGGGILGSNEETTQFMKNYLITAIQNNLTSSSSISINSETGQMSIMEQGAKKTDSADDIFNRYAILRSQRI